MQIEQEQLNALLEESLELQTETGLAARSFEVFGRASETEQILKGQANQIADIAQRSQDE